MNKDTFLELINNSVVKSYPEKIFGTEKKYKNIIQDIIEKALNDGEDTIFDDIYGDNGIKEENNKIYFKLNPSKIKEKYGLLFFGEEQEFLKKVGIKPLNNQIFIFDKKEKLNEYLICYNFFVKLKKFLLNLGISADKINNEIILYYKEPIHIKESATQLNCDKLKEKQQFFEKLQKDIQSDPQTKSEFLKKAIYDIFKEKIKNQTLTINDIVEKFNEIYSEYEIIKRAYIDSLDTDKIKDDFKNKYQEALNFINNILSNLYTKTLFIPLALIFGISQKLTSQDYSNQIFIFFSLILFFFILAYLIWGNIQVLENIKIQIKELEDETKYYQSFKSKLDTLIKSYKGVRNRIYFMLFIIGISIILLIYIYCPILKDFFLCKIN
ncbi:MAG: hypothetical protein ABGX26_02705 [Nautiliaceae bacterium]